MSLQSEIDKLKTLQESFSELSKKVLDTQAVLTELNHGKQKMVDALATKNVQSSADKTLSAIADDVRSIAQSPITIEGGEMYEKQLFGAPTDKTNAYEQPDSPLWNLYQVMANLLSDGRFVTYGGIVLCEYEHGESIVLQGAEAGGAYLTCDGYFYDVNATHVWSNDVKSNPWVAYLLASEYTNFTIGSSDVCPTSIHIGRKVGEIICTIAGKIREIVCTEGNEYSLNFTSTQTWGQSVVLKGMTTTRAAVLRDTSTIRYFCCDIETIGDTTVLVSNATNLNSIYLPKIRTIKSASNGSRIYNKFQKVSNVKYIDMPCLESIINDGYFIEGNKIIYANLPSLRRIQGEDAYGYGGGALCRTLLKKIVLPSLEYVGVFNGYAAALSYNSLLTEIELPKLTHLGGTVHAYTNELINGNPLLERVKLGTLIHGKDGSSTTHRRIFASCPKLIDIEIGEGVDISLYWAGWKPTTVLADAEQVAILNENIRNHVVAKLNDRTGLTSKTFVVSQELWDALEQETLDAFAAKNWTTSGVQY